jgi:hypothetical protein
VRPRSHREDSIDALWLLWAPQRRKVLGFSGLVHCSEYLGPQSSIAGKIKDDAYGAGYSVASQQWPEVFTGDALVVNQAWHAMPELPRVVADMRWVVRGPVTLKVAYIGIDKREFWRKVDFCKTWLSAWIAAHPEPSAHFGARAAVEFSVASPRFAR